MIQRSTFCCASLVLAHIVWDEDLGMKIRITSNVFDWRSKMPE